MPFKVFLSSLLHEASVLAECFWAALLEYLVPRWTSHHLELGAPFQGCLGCGPAKRHAIHRVWGRGVAFWVWGSPQAPGQEELLKQMVAQAGEAPCDKVNGWDMGACPINMWWEATNAPLSSAGLACKAAWQAERKSIWLLPSSWMTCSSRCLMVLACCLWSDSALEAPWVSASLMAMEQVVSASQIVWAQVASASLTVEEQRASASMATWEQMALTSLMDSAVSESFQQSSIPSSQTTFYLQASVDDLVANSSFRALLAFSQSWPASAGGVTLLDLGVTAMAEMVVGTFPREVSAISMSSRALTWDKVSTGLGRSLSLWGGVVSTTTGFGLFGVKFPDPWPDMSNIAQDRRLLTSMVILTSLSSFGGVVLRGLAIMTAEHFPGGDAFQSLGRWICLLLGLCHWPGTWAGRLWQSPHVHSTLVGRQPAGLRRGAGRLPVGWFFCRWSCQSLLEAGSLGASP